MGQLVQEQARGSEGKQGDIQSLCIYRTGGYGSTELKPVVQRHHEVSSSFALLFGQWPNRGQSPFKWGGPLCQALRALLQALRPLWQALRPLRPLGQALRLLWQALRLYQLAIRPLQLALKILRWTADEQMDVQTYGISPHSTELCPLLGPLPCY